MKYKNPPVVETVLSVQFNPLRNFGAGHLGAYWNRLGPDWPFVADAPAVDPVFEQFESPNVWKRAAFVKLSTKADLRLQIRNATRDRMIQVQNGRFFYNWLRTSETEYPSYDVVRPGFDEHWEIFREFAESQSNTNDVLPNQWEILYVNHIPRGAIWSELSDLPEAFNLLAQPDLGETGLLPDGLSGEWRFEICPNKGRLYVTLGMKASEPDNTPCLVMTLLARGPVTEEFSLDSGLELGHATISKAFNQITSKTAKEIWGIPNAEQRTQYH